MLHTTSGILRCESIHRAELSDFLDLMLKKKQDPHPLTLMITQLPAGKSKSILTRYNFPLFFLISCLCVPPLPCFRLSFSLLTCSRHFILLKGKTNHGQTLYGRATWHKDVSLCCIGALAFYLMYRFSVTREFENFTLEDWMDNSRWFDIKLLVDLQGFDHTKSLKNRSYADAIKMILVFLGIAAKKLVHLGRNLGAKFLEMLEEETRVIETMGNWNPSMQSSCYSTKLPMQPVRKLAGFTDANGMYYNPRTMVEVEESLLRLTPVGCWLFDAHKAVNIANQDGGAGKFTAMNFLSFMMTLNRVFIQDAAAMLVLFPERIDHPLFRLEVFQSEEFHVSFFLFLLLLLLFFTNSVLYFKRFKLKMQVTLNDKNVSPLDATLESVMPGVHQRFVVMEGHVNKLDRNLVSGFENLEGKVDGLAGHFTDLLAYNRERDAQLADHLMMIAARLGTPSGSTSTLRPFSPPRPQQVLQSPSRGGDNQPPSPVVAMRH